MKNKVDVISIDFRVSGTRIFIPFRAVCSVTDKEFSGEVVIEYIPKNKAVEYVDMEKVVNEISSRRTTAEDLTKRHLFDSQKINNSEIFESHGRC